MNILRILFVCTCQGYNVLEAFHRICLYTADLQIRDTLSRVNNLLTEDEHDALTFIRRLESLYTCRSFEAAKRHLVQQNR